MDSTAKLGMSIGAAKQPEIEILGVPTQLSM